MVNSSEEIQDEFEVYPPLGSTSQDFKNILSSFHETLKPEETAKRRRADEDHDDVLIRLALNATHDTTVLFRKNDFAEDTKIQAWLSIVSEKSKSFAIRHALTDFESLSYDDLREIAKLSQDVNNISKITDILAESFGIVLIVEQGFKAMKMDGCVFKLSQGTPVVGISVRFNRYDNFWFTLMHELAHISLHYDQLDQPIIDDLEEESAASTEVEANIVAKDSLVPRRFWRLIWAARNSSEGNKQLLELCAKAETHPAIAAGMLKNQSKNYTLYPEFNQTIDIRRAFGFTDD